MNPLQWIFRAFQGKPVGEDHETADDRDATPDRAAMPESTAIPEREVPEGYPPTIGPGPLSDASEQEMIFDPSLRQFLRAFRRGDPKLPPPEMERWLMARRRVIRHILELVAHGPYAHQLVLRGSCALKAALGEAAREPGDIDWVVTPPTLKMRTRQAHALLAGVVEMVKNNARLGDVQIDVAGMARTEIWTYERAPGERIAFPWQCGELPPAMVQMDFVFEETLRTPPVMRSFPREDGSAFSLAAASDEESLAWKLLWLASDSYPQGKDLYDAVLLAERTPIRAELLRAVLEEGRESVRDYKHFPFSAGDQRLETEWGHFLKECPWVQGTKEEWVARLQERIRPVAEEIWKQTESDFA